VCVIYLMMLDALCFIGMICIYFLILVSWIDSDDSSEIIRVDILIVCSVHV